MTGPNALLAAAAAVAETWFKSTSTQQLALTELHPRLAQALYQLPTKSVPAGAARCPRCDHTADDHGPSGCTFTVYFNPVERTPPAMCLCTDTAVPVALTAGAVTALVAATDEEDLELIGRTLHAATGCVADHGELEELDEKTARRVLIALTRARRIGTRVVGLADVVAADQAALTLAMVEDKLRAIAVRLETQGTPSSRTASVGVRLACVKVLELADKAAGGG